MDGPTRDADSSIEGRPTTPHSSMPSTNARNSIVPNMADMAIAHPAMPSVGSAAPDFNCKAVVDGRIQGEYFTDGYLLRRHMLMLVLFT